MRKLNLILVLILSISIITCGSSSDDGGGSNEFDGTGLLPDGVKATINGDDTNCTSNLESTYTIIIEITNSNSTSETITISAGLVFKPTSNSYQPMMVFNEIEIIIPAGTTQTYCIPVFCIDANVHAPDEDAYYNGFYIINSSDTGCLATILDYLEDVDLSTISAMDIMQIQMIIWDCTTNNQLTPANEAWLAAL